jgi:hypothetical protein
MARTENIFIPILIHALINFSFEAGVLSTGINELETTSAAANVLNSNSSLPMCFFFLSCQVACLCSQKATKHYF